MILKVITSLLNDTERVEVKISIKKICFLSVLAALLIVSKVALQTIPYLEIVTLLFVVFGMTLSIRDCFIVFSVFFFVNMAINGVGYYWIPYIIFFPITFTLSYFVKKSINRYLYGSLIALNCGFLIFATYFVYDWILFGTSVAISNGITAFWFNIVEGLINSILFVMIGIALIKIIMFMKKRLNLDQNEANTSTLFNKKFGMKGKVLYAFFALIPIGFIAIIPFYLFSNPNVLQSNNKGTAPLDQSKDYTLDETKNQCVINLVKEQEKLFEVIDNCNTYNTLGKILDSLPKTYNVRYIDKYQIDSNFDGIMERFVGSINVESKSFYTNNMCPIIYQNNIPINRGVDLFKPNVNYVYKFVFSTNSC